MPTSTSPRWVVQVLSRLIRGYNYRFQPRSHALDLVESMHIVLGIVDRLVAAGRVCVLKRERAGG